MTIGGLIQLVFVIVTLGALSFLLYKKLSRSRESNKPASALDLRSKSSADARSITTVSSKSSSEPTGATSVPSREAVTAKYLKLRNDAMNAARTPQEASQALLRLSNAEAEEMKPILAAEKPLLAAKEANEKNSTNNEIDSWIKMPLDAQLGALLLFRAQHGTYLFGQRLQQIAQRHRNSGAVPLLAAVYRQEHDRELKERLSYTLLGFDAGHIRTEFTIDELGKMLTNRFDWGDRNIKDLLIDMGDEALPFLLSRVDSRPSRLDPGAAKVHWNTAVSVLGQLGRPEHLPRIDALANTAGAAVPGLREACAEASASIQARR